MELLFGQVLAWEGVSGLEAAHSADSEVNSVSRTHGGPHSLLSTICAWWPLCGGEGVK